MVAGVLHKVADGAGLRIANHPLFVNPDHVACTVLCKACQGGGQGKPNLLAQCFGCGCVIVDGAVWQVDVKMLMRFVVACFQLDQGQLRLGVVEQ